MILNERLERRAAEVSRTSIRSSARLLMRLLGGRLSTSPRIESLPSPTPSQEVTVILAIARSLSLQTRGHEPEKVARWKNGRPSSVGWLGESGEDKMHLHVMKLS